jgi:UDP-N-acetylglucosamine--N-acetylmuramyl-(pentapeptide) pyrophosphoryl-undecaprenol N-acetylglucosamine transferase
VTAERDALAKEALTEFGLDAGRRTLMVTGGSQGALHVNTAALDAIGQLRDRLDLQILLLTGPTHERGVSNALPPGGVRVHVRGFLERMELGYALADLVVSRAGAATCAELSVCGLPAILVPYPHATGRHQEANARALERAGGALVVMDPDLTGTTLASAVGEILDDEARLRSMGARMRSRSRPDAAEALARVVMEAGGRR